MRGRSSQSQDGNGATVGCVHEHDSGGPRGQSQVGDVLHADLDSFIGHEWQAFQLAQDTYGSSELGEYEYTIRKFENGFLIRIATEEEGVFVTADGLTLQDFDDVATALRETLKTWREPA